MHCFKALFYNILEKNLKNLPNRKPLSTPTLVKDRGFVAGPVATFERLPDYILKV
jgi:hypothetical protein